MMAHLSRRSGTSEGAGGSRVSNRYLDPCSNGIAANQFYPRPQPVMPSSFLCNDLGASGQSTFDLLQSISITMSNVQTKLAAIEEMTQKHDKTFQQLEEKLENLQKSHSDWEQSREPKYKSKSRKSPPGLSACVRKVHSAQEESKQYHADERINSNHNKAVTDRIVDHIIAGKDYTRKDEIAYAAKKYHEYLVRQEKPLSEEEKGLLAKSNRIIQRRQRLFERRMKVAVRRQMAVMQKLNEKYMSDEETDNEDSSVLIRRSLPWRSQPLNKLIMRLDQEYLKKKDRLKPSKKRIDGTYSNRTPPVNAPSWAIVREEVPIIASEDDTSTSISDPTHELSDSTAEESTLNSSTCTTTSGSDGINGDQDESSEEENDDELNEFFQAVTGKHP